MKLQNDFYTVESRLCHDQQEEYIIRLNASHAIYRAHFPGNPITPGVCIIRIVQELAEEQLGRKTFLHEVTKARFMNVLDPLQHERVHVAVSSVEVTDGMKVTATVQNGETVFASLSLLLQ